MPSDITVFLGGPQKGARYHMIAQVPGTTSGVGIWHYGVLVGNRFICSRRMRGNPQRPSPHRKKGMGRARLAKTARFPLYRRSDFAEGAMGLVFPRPD